MAATIKRRPSARILSSGPSARFVGGSRTQAARPAPSPQPQQQYQPQPQRQVPSAEDIVREATRQFNEQKQFVKDFLTKNPFIFDEAMTRAARERMESQYRPYYERLFEEFVTPIRQKISQSLESMSSVLGELVRRRELGEVQKEREISEGLEEARAGFAGRGTLMGGRASRAIARKGIESGEELEDFRARSQAEEQGQLREQRQLGERGEQAIGFEERKYFGAGGEFGEKVTKGITAEKERKAQQKKVEAVEAAQSRFGSNLRLGEEDIRFRQGSFIY